MNIKLSLAMIVKPSNSEAKLLDRALSFVAKYVDEICITQAGEKPNKEVSKIIKKYKGKESFFKWVNDFSKARNFNFNQTAGEFIFWIDADDVVRGAKKLKGLVEKMEKDKIDAVVMHYLYDFTNTKKHICTVKHLKTRIVKRDVVRWIGKIHEDFMPLRELSPMMTEEIEILHITDDKRANESSQRNTDIAMECLKKNPDDARNYWLVANALMGQKKEKEAVPYFLDFIKKSNSHEEIYIAFLRLGDIEKSITYYLQALAIRPGYPDAFLKIGELYLNQKEYDLAKRFLIMGLKIKVPEREIVVYNPRDYDFNPLMLLVKIYFEIKEYENAILVLERCRKIIPDHPEVKKSLGLIKKYRETEKKVDKILKKAQKIDKKDLKRFLDKIPDDLKSHPKLAVFRNLHFIKKKSSGKDIAYYCSYTDSKWTPESDKIGGSEEAVINLSKKWVEQGYNVTVYNNCGSKEQVFDGVVYKPHWMYNPKDAFDYLILWRHPRPLDFKHNSKKIFVDVHDVIPEGEFTKDRVKKLDKIFVKTKAHRNLFPSIPDEKFAIIPNGLDPEPFKREVKRNPYLILNTSSPERHLDATLDVFEKLIEKSDKPWKLAWYYGWHHYLRWHKDHKGLMDYYRVQNARFQKLVKAGRAEGGMMIPQNEIAKKYLEAGVFLYPTQFFEIHCISAAKAQLAGCRMITSDFAALNETVQFGDKIHTSGKKWGTSDTFGDTENIDKYVEEILKGGDVSEEQSKWSEDTYRWERISKLWLSEI